MLKNLIIDAFEKVKGNLIIHGLKNPSNNLIAQHLSNHMLKGTEFSITKKSLLKYYNNGLELIDSDNDIIISKLEIINSLCQYLGYEDYQDYVEKNPVNNNDATNRNTANKDTSTSTTTAQNKEMFSWFGTSPYMFKTFFIAFIIIGILGVCAYHFLKSDDSRWMVWKEDHYEEVEFDSKKLSNGILKIYNEDRIIDFREINADCNTKFFNEDGSVRIWYGKDKDGNVDCFTSLGKHPETGKTLKEITPYMINKYLCPRYGD